MVCGQWVHLPRSWPQLATLHPPFGLCSVSSASTSTTSCQVEFSVPSTIPRCIRPNDPTQSWKLADSNFLLPTSSILTHVVCHRHHDPGPGSMGVKNQSLESPVVRRLVSAPPGNVLSPQMYLHHGSTVLMTVPQTNQTQMPPFFSLPLVLNARGATCFPLYLASILPRQGKGAQPRTLNPPSRWSEINCKRRPAAGKPAVAVPAFLTYSNSNNSPTLSDCDCDSRFSNNAST